MHLYNVFSNVSNKLIVEYFIKVFFTGFSGCPAHKFKTAKKAQRSMGIVLGSLVAAAVIAVFIQEIVQ